MPKCLLDFEAIIHAKTAYNAISQCNIGHTTLSDMYSMKQALLEKIAKLKWSVTQSNIQFCKSKHSKGKKPL